MDASREHLYTLQLEVRWGDMDAVGHVNNAMYFRYIEQTRVSWLESIGLYVSKESDGPVIVNASCTFLKPVVYPATLEIEMFGGSPGRSSFDGYYEIRDVKNSDTLYARASDRVVWVDHKLGRSKEIPVAIRQFLPQVNTTQEQA